MLPFDIHDPEMDPMKAKALKEAEQGGKFAWGTAYNGHFDQTGHFKGRVAVRGKTRIRSIAFRRWTIAGGRDRSAALRT